MNVGELKEFIAEMDDNSEVRVQIAQRTVDLPGTDPTRSKKIVTTTSEIRVLRISDPTPRLIFTTELNMGL